MTSLVSERIKAVRIEILCSDTAGRFLETVPYSYLDLSAGHIKAFGQDKLILLSNKETRSFSVSVTEVVFEDDSIWTEGEEKWEPLPRPLDLSERLTDYELLKEYRLQYGENCRYCYQEAFDLWQCPCGTWNKQADDICLCGKKAADCKAFDLQALEERKNIRLAKEEEELLWQLEEAEKKRRKTIKHRKIGAIAVSVIVIVWILLGCVIIPAGHYKKGLELCKAEKYDQAAMAFFKAGNYKNARDRFWSMKQASASAFASGEYHDVELQRNGTVLVTKHDDWAYWHDYGQCDVDKWNNIVAVAAGNDHTVGLKSNGTVLATGSNYCGQCDVGNWSDIVAVAAGYEHTVGLKSDGTVLATGSNYCGQCDVYNWTDIVEIDAYGNITIGYKSDGTKLEAGEYDW